MKKPAERTSILSSATVVAALISAVAAVLTAVLPWLLKSHGQPREVENPPAATMQAPSSNVVGPNGIPTGPLAPSAAITPIPNLTFGAWSIVDSIDEAGTDFSGSTLKFVSQRELASGLEATGFFEWRSGSQVLGREYVVANFDMASRQLFIEGKSVESPAGILAVGSFSARVSNDGRELLDGRWGDTPANQHGVFGKWQARR